MSKSPVLPFLALAMIFTVSAGVAHLWAQADAAKPDAAKPDALKPETAAAPAMAQPQAPTPAKKPHARRYESDEAKARRIAARYGISW